MVDLTGKTLGKYRVMERLGRGGMAEVYKAYHPHLDRYVALKVLHGYLTEGGDFMERFNREAKAVANLRHSNIVQVFDFDIEDETPYMVMEFIDGETLKATMDHFAKQGKTMPLAEAIEIFRQVALALAYAHEQGLYHRDIKPSNVMVGEDGKVYLTDFGIARIVSDTQFTASGALLGTPAYMAPEQALGEKLTAACDIYSLGIVLYELITGQVPFDSDTPMAVIQKHLNSPLPMPSTIRADIPSRLEMVVLKALSKAPEDRYQNVSDMLQDVEKALLDVPLPVSDEKETLVAEKAATPKKKGKKEKPEWRSIPGKKKGLPRWVIVAATSAYKAKTGDIDNDGDMDIVTARSWDKAPIQLWRNTIKKKQ